MKALVVFCCSVPASPIPDPSKMSSDMSKAASVAAWASWLARTYSSKLPANVPASTALRCPSLMGEPKQSVPETNKTLSRPMRSRKKRA